MIGSNEHGLSGVSKTVSDNSLLFCRKNKVLLLIYVDYILINQIINVAANLNKKFVLKTLGSVHYFLGFKAHRNSNGLVLTQIKYVNELLAKTNMTTAKPSPTPMFIGNKLSLNDNDLLINPLYTEVLLEHYNTLL